MATNRQCKTCSYDKEKISRESNINCIFKISKSTVHKDLTERLKKINRELYQSARGILDTNKAERHLRGGEATRKKYK